MKCNRLKIFTQSLLISIVVVFPYWVFAQDPGGGPDVPVDGGLSLLIAAGVGYGIKKYRDSKKIDLEK